MDSVPPAIGQALVAGAFALAMLLGFAVARIPLENWPPELVLPSSAPAP